MFGFSNFDDSESDFSEFGESDDITYIDPEFGSVLSSDESLDGTGINYDANVILGTQGRDFIFANQIRRMKMGTLFMGLMALMICQEGTIGILFILTIQMTVLKIL